MASVVAILATPAFAVDAFAPCAACHSLKEGKTGVGPSLAGVLGRRAGMAPGFRFSNALRASGILWTYETLDRFLANPQSLVPGNRMPFSGVSDAAQRAAIIKALDAH